MTIAQNIKDVEKLKDLILAEQWLVDGIEECRRYFTIPFTHTIKHGYNDLGAIRVSKCKGKANALQIALNKLNEFRHHSPLKQES